MRDEYGLTHKQRLWADAYIETGNAREADRRAGYKHRMDGQNGQIPTVKAYIEARMQPAAEARIASMDEVLQYLTRVMLGEEKDQFGLDASLQDRTKAAQELLKRYAVADDRQRGTMQRLDSIFAEFKVAVQSGPQSVQERPAEQTGERSEAPAESAGEQEQSGPESAEETA